MKTKKFDLRFDGVNFSETRLDVRVNVETDYAQHCAHRVTQGNSLPRVYADSGRVYTPDQASHIENFVSFYIDTIQQKINDWFVVHSFIGLPKEAYTSLTMNAEFEITDFSYHRM